MSDIKRIDFEYNIGCHHNNENELVGGFPVKMVALFDISKISEEEAIKQIERNTETKDIMFVSKQHYDNILKKAVEEAKVRIVKQKMAVKDTEIWYYSTDDEWSPIKCKIANIIRGTNGFVKEITIVMFDKYGNQFDEIETIGEKEVKNMFKCLFFEKEDIPLHHSFAFWEV